jgi:PAS domain-containing protein
MRDEHHTGTGFEFVTPGAGEAQVTAVSRSERLMPVANLLILVHDAFFVRSMSGVIRYWNRAAEELYGWTVTKPLAR